MPERTHERLGDRDDGRIVVDRERWALVVEAAARDNGEIDLIVVRMMAHLIRTRALTDAYAAARLVRSFKTGIDEARDAAIDTIASAVRNAATTQD